MERFVKKIKKQLSLSIAVYFLGVIGASFINDSGARLFSGVFAFFFGVYICFVIFYLWRIKKTDLASQNKSAFLYSIFASIGGIFVSVTSFLVSFYLLVPDKARGFSCDVVSFPNPIEKTFWVEVVSFLQHVEDSSLFAGSLMIFLITVFFSSLVFFIFSILAKKDKESPIRHLASIFYGTIFIIGLLFIFMIMGLNSARVKSVDARRIADMKQTQLALELYFDDSYDRNKDRLGRNGHYPIVVGNTSEERWENLSTFLAPDHIAHLPNDPCTYKGFPKHQYEYKNSSDGKSYVVKTILSEPSNPGLLSDLDGEVFGLWCGKEGKEIEYCAGN